MCSDFGIELVILTRLVSNKLFGGQSGNLEAD